jgi:hypothetical protein
MLSPRGLIEVAAEKSALREQIALRRMQCADMANAVAQPLGRLDNSLSKWRKFLPQRSILKKAFRWGPLLFGAIRIFARTRG